MKLMKKEGILKLAGVLFFVLVSVFAFAPKSQAADEAAFSFTSDKTSYHVGDDVVLSLVVNAGTHNTTLNVIDFDLKISDFTVVDPKNQTSFFAPGAIFSQVGIQTYTNGVLNIVTYVDPANPPTSRSGVIGTVTLKALKVGRSTVTYDRINATDQNKEMDWIATTASSIDINVVEATATTAATPTSASATTARTATVKAATTSATTASTGPGTVFLVALTGGLLLYFVYKMSFRGKKV